MVRGIYRQPRVAQNVWREVFHHLQVHGHPNIVNIIQVVLLDTEDTAAIVTELQHSNMLKHASNGWPKEEVTDVVNCCSQQLLTALAHIHSKGIVHSDIKLANFLIGQGGRILITDFGSACRHGYPRGTEGGPLTDWYRAPEVWLGAENLDAATDVWAMGCCLAELALKGKPLFPHSTADEAIAAMHFRLDNDAAQLREQLSESGLCEETVSLVVQMLALEPEQRISALEALETGPWEVPEVIPGPVPPPKSTPGTEMSASSMMTLEGQALASILQLRRSFDVTLSVDQTRACFDKLGLLHPLVSVQREREVLKLGSIEGMA